MPLPGWVTQGDVLPSPKSQQTAGAPPSAPASQTQSSASGNYNPNNPIPGSSVYLNETNAANLAYNNAKNQLLAQRNSLYHQYGLTDTGSVDPLNQYGEYQSLLGTEGAALDQADNAALDRGLGVGGIANQGESALRTSQGAEQLAFQRQVDQAGLDYSQGLQNAEVARANAINQAYMDALNTAIASGYFNTPSPDSATGITITPKQNSKTNLIKAVTAANKPYAVKVAANKTGASANKKQGIFSIH